MPRGKKQDTVLTPSEMFLKIYLEETNVNYTMLYRFDEACRLFRLRYGMRQPYSTLRGFKSSYYKTLSS